MVYIRVVNPSTDLPPASLIQITALPPATTTPQAVLHKLPYHRQLNVLYLIPLFIALGVVLGALAAVILLKWRANRQPLLCTSTFLPGPPYVPPENDVEDRLLVHGHPSMEQVPLYAATPSKFTVHGSRYTPKRTFAWKSFDATRPTYVPTIIPSSDGERFTVIAEEDPFLTTPSGLPGRSPKLSNNASSPRMSGSSSPPDPVSVDNAAHQHTDLPKPFRRSMFDILKLKRPHLPAPSARKEYAVHVLDEELSEKSPAKGLHRVSSLKTTITGEHDTQGGGFSLDDGFTIGNMEDTLILQGGEQGFANITVLPDHTFDLKEGTSSPTRCEKPRKVTPFASEFNGSQKVATYDGDNLITVYSGDGPEEKHPDIYTKAPERYRFRTPHRESPRGVSRRSSAPDTHASVLPRSPPSVMSSPLEKSLFFTTSLSSSTSLAGRMHALALDHSSPLGHAGGSPELSLFPLPSNKTRSTEKLQSKKSELSLPYPSYPDHVRARSTPRERSISADIKERSVSPGSPKLKGRSTNAAHQESATGIWSLGSLSQTSLAIALASSSCSDVLGRVNDIVAQGYTKRRSSMEGTYYQTAARLPETDASLGCRT